MQITKTQRSIKGVDVLKQHLVLANFSSEFRIINRKIRILEDNLEIFKNIEKDDSHNYHVEKQEKLD